MVHRESSRSSLHWKQWWFLRCCVIKEFSIRNSQWGQCWEKHYYYYYYYYLGNIVLFSEVCTKIFFILIKPKSTDTAFLFNPKAFHQEQRKFNILITLWCNSQWLSDIINETGVNKWEGIKRKGWVFITDSSHQKSHSFKSIFKIFLNSMHSSTDKQTAGWNMQYIY